MSQSRGLLLLFIVILTLPIWTLIENSQYAQGWNPQRSSHERFELSKPWFFSTFVLPAMLEDQQRLKKVSHPVFTTKKWATQFSLQKSTGMPFHKFPVFFEFELVFKLRFWIWICTWIWNLKLTYYIFLGVGVRQMTSLQVLELSLKKELPVIFLSLPAREQATIHILLP